MRNALHKALLFLTLPVDTIAASPLPPTLRNLRRNEFSKTARHSASLEKLLKPRPGSNRARAAALSVLAGVALAPVGHAADLTWNLGTGGAWDTTTANWTGGASIFTNGDNVTFNNNGGGTINIIGTVSPGADDSERHSRFL